MNLPDKETLEEVAKAAQEVSKLGTSVVDAATKVGAFIAEAIGGPLETGIGIWHDRLKYARWERQVRFMQRADEFLNVVGQTHLIRRLPLNFAIPLLQAASLEEDDDLQDMWAKMLVNGLAGTNENDIRRANIDILQSLSPLEALILSKIYSTQLDSALTNSVLTNELPDRITLSSTLSRDALSEAKEPADDIKLALANLTRLGCISLGTSWGGNQLFRAVHHTILGRKFMEACTLRTP